MLEKLDYYTIEEIAELLRVTKNTVYRWTYAGKLKSQKVGGTVRVSQDDLDLFLNKK